MRIFLFIMIIMILLSPQAYSHACDCNAGNSQMRVCLFTDPVNIQLSGDTFDFDIKIRNYFRGGTLTDIATSVESCSRQGGGSCTWSESGNTDFQVSIDPDYISSVPAGSGPGGGLPNFSPEECRNWPYEERYEGRIDTVNTRIKINNAADGTYTLRFRVGWNPNDKERFIDVTISFTSSGGCSSDSDCPGQICCGGDCVDSECGSDSDCSSQTCKTRSCNNAGTCSASCSYSDVSDGSSCSGGTCCSGNCDTSTGNSGYDSSCRSGPTCHGSSWEYDEANNGVVCSGDCTVCNNGYCNQDDDGECGSGETCQSGTCVSSCSDTCTSLGFECGTHTICGTNQNCGSCSTGYSCDSSGQCVQDCTDTCSSLGYQCGTHTICGSSQNCGSCSSGYSCNGQGQCVQDCTDTCSSLGYQCGTHTICGSSQNCGSCSSGYSCNGQGQCVQDCTDTCASLGYECGTYTICGSSQNCGSCSSGYSCNGQGQCVQDCTDTCTSLGYECGTHTICGSSQNCGSCSSGEICQSGSCVVDCDDECQNQEERCNSDTVQICSHDADNCLVWTDDETCIEGDICYDDGIYAQCETPACLINSDCDDSNACTINVCNNPGQHDAQCVLSTKQCALSGEDGCCPAGCTVDTDSDCVACNVEADCDTSELCCANICYIPECNSDADCTDTNECTDDECLNPDTCNSYCENSLIIDNIDDDGCCPGSSDFSDDNDCLFRCSVLNEVECGVETECTWCPIYGSSGKCLDKDVIECTSKTCSSEGKFCRECK